MSTIGIIAEFNPLHTGHEYLLNEAKKRGTVVCVMSGNFVQRGALAIFPKHTRAKMALMCGCDLCAELPIYWAMSTAQNFALGAVSILNNLGCDTIMFGSECGDVSPLLNVADILESDNYKIYLSAELKKGITFAKARENAVFKCGGEAELLLGANNNLAIEYIIAARKINPDINFKTVKRIGAQHDSMLENDYVSASYLRDKIIKNDLSATAKYIPEKLFELYKDAPVSDIKTLEKAILSVLRTRTAKELKNLPDISEGLDNKLYSSIRTATSLEDLYDKLKVKRYTLARIRRLVLAAFIGLDNSFFMKEPPYIRVLGFSKLGEEILRNGSKLSAVPVITKSSQIDELSNTAKAVFEAECKASDLYNLSLSKPLECGSEFTEKIIKTQF